MESNPESAPPRRLGRNRGGYHGEAIDIRLVLRAIHEAAEARGWQSETFYSASSPPLRGYLRKSGGPALRCYLSAGIHGDEPAGPVAVLQLLEEDQWPEGVDVWLCPCLNLTGFQINRRENDRGIDQNRDYRHPQAAETKAHVQWLSGQPTFDLSVILHEDWESGGYYLYEVNPERRPSAGPSVIERVAAVCPIETASHADDWPVQEGIIRPTVSPSERPLWPEALYLITQKTPVSYTLEAPSDFDLRVRARAHVVAVRTILEHAVAQAR